MNPFQAQYPLSPKKFWKKMISALLGQAFFVVTLFISIGIVLILVGNDSIVTRILWAVVGFFSIELILVTIFSAWYFKAYIRTYFYEGGDNFITIRKKVFTPSEIHVQYQKIQDVYVDQDLLDRIMGLYDVHIASATAASGIEAHIDGVEKNVADGLKNYFFERIQNSNSQQPPAAAAGTVAPSAETTAPQFTGDISSKTYPIKAAWMFTNILGALVSSFFLAALLALYALKDLTFEAGSTLFLGAFVVSLVFHVIGLVLWKHNYSFTFLPDYIQFHTGIISQQERHLPYKSIQDVTVNRSLLDRVFGLANVTIENAAQTMTVTAQGRAGIQNGVKIVGITPEQANKITEELKNVILTKNSSQMGV